MFVFYNTGKIKNLIWQFPTRSSCAGRETRCAIREERPSDRKDSWYWGWNHQLSSLPWSPRRTPALHRSDTGSNWTSAPVSGITRQTLLYFKHQQWECSANRLCSCRSYLQCTVLENTRGGGVMRGALLRVRTSARAPWNQICRPTWKQYWKLASLA